MADAIKSPLSFSTFKFNIIGNNPLLHRISAAATQDQSTFDEGEGSYADMDNASAAEPPDQGLKLLGRLSDNRQALDSSGASFHPDETFSHAYTYHSLETHQASGTLAATGQTLASAITSDDSGMDLQRQNNTEVPRFLFFMHKAEAYTKENVDGDASGIMLQVPQATVNGAMNSHLPTPPSSNSLLSFQNDAATSNKLGRSLLPADPFAQLSQLVQEEQAAWGEVLEGKRTQLESPSDMSISPLPVSRSPSVLSERPNEGRFAPAIVQQAGQSHLAANISGSTNAQRSGASPAYTNRTPTILSPDIVSSLSSIPPVSLQTSVDEEQRTATHLSSPTTSPNSTVSFDDPPVQSRMVSDSSCISFISAPRIILANDVNFASTHSEASSLGKRKDATCVAPPDVIASFNEDDDPRASKRHKLTTYQSANNEAKSPMLSSKVQPEQSSPLLRELFLDACAPEPTPVMHEGHVTSSYANSRRKRRSLSEMSEDSDCLSSASLAYPAPGATKRTKTGDDDVDLNNQIKVEEDLSNLILNPDSPNYPIAKDFSGQADVASLQAEEIPLSSRTREISESEVSISREQDKQTKTQGLPEHLESPRQNDPQNDAPKQDTQTQEQQEQGLHWRSSRQSPSKQQQPRNKEANSLLVPSKVGASPLSAGYETGECENPQVEFQTLCGPHRIVTSERVELQKEIAHESSRSCEMQRDCQSPTSALVDSNRLSVQCPARPDPVPASASNASKSPGMNSNEDASCSTAAFGPHSRAMQRREFAHERPPYAHDHWSSQAHPSSRHLRLADTYRPRTPSPEPQLRELVDSYVPSYGRERPPPRYLRKDYNRIQPRHSRSKSPVRHIWPEDRHYRPSPAPLVREHSNRCDDRPMSFASGNAEGTLSPDSRLGSKLSLTVGPSPTSDQEERNSVPLQRAFADSTNRPPRHDDRESRHEESSRIHLGIEHQFIPNGTWDQSADSITPGSSEHCNYHVPIEKGAGTAEQERQQQHATGTAVHQQAESLVTRPHERETDLPLSESSRPVFSDEGVARSQPFRPHTPKDRVDMTLSCVGNSASRISAFENDAVKHNSNTAPTSESRKNIAEDQVHTSNEMRVRRIDRPDQIDVVLTRNDARLQRDPSKDVYKGSKSRQNAPETDRLIGSRLTTYETLEHLEADHPLARTAAQTGSSDNMPPSPMYNQEHTLEIFKKSSKTLGRFYDTTRLPVGDSEHSSIQTDKEKMRNRVGLGNHCISEQLAESDSLQLSNFRVSSPTDSPNRASVSLESRIGETTTVYVNESSPLRRFTTAGPVASSAGRNLRDRVSEQATSATLSLPPKPDPHRFPIKGRSDPEASSTTNRPSLLSRMGNEQVSGHKLTPSHQPGQDQGRHASSSARRGREYKNTGNVPHRSSSSAFERPSLANRIT